MTHQDVSVTPLPNHRYLINKEIRYKDILVPKGYITNGADIPRLFWSIFPPNRSDYLPSVIVHDYMCDYHDRILADQYFNEILELLYVNDFTRYSLVTAVKLYTKIIMIKNRIKLN